MELMVSGHDVFRSSAKSANQASIFQFESTLLCMNNFQTLKIKSLIPPCSLSNNFQKVISGA